MAAKRIFMTGMKFKSLAVVLTLTASISLSGCGNNIIFRNTTEENAAYAVASLDTLLADQFYVKDGTSFYPMHTFGSESSQYAPHPEGDNMLLFEDQENSIPVLYKNEAVCVKSGDTSVLSSIIVERYKPVSWTLGVRNLSYDDTGEYFKANKDDEKQDSSIYSVIDRTVNGDDYSIRTLNGKSFSISRAGTIRKLKKDETYELGIFVGSEHAEVNASADSHLYESSETFNVEPQNLTEIGYVEYRLPDDAKSGIYLFGDAGYVRYIAERKAKVKDVNDYNLIEPNTFDGITHAIDDTLSKAEYTKTFRLSSYLDRTQIRLQYSQQYVQIDSAYIVTPGGDQINIDVSSGSLELKDPEEGEYSVVMYGYNTLDVVINHSDSDGNIEEDEPETPTPTPTPTSTPTPTPVEEPESTSGELQAEDITETPTPTPEADSTGGGTVTQQTPAPVQQTAPSTQQQTYTEPQETYEYYYETDDGGGSGTKGFDTGEIGNTVPG